MKLTLTRLEARDVPAARLQIIHNSPFAQVRTVDVYVNDNLFLNDLPFQSATEYLEMASNTELAIDITAANAANNANPLMSTVLNLDADSTTVAVLVGEPNTSMRMALAAGRTKTANPVHAEVLGFNGSPDFANVDLRIRGVGRAGDDLSVGEFSPNYQALAAADFTADASAATGGIPFAVSKLALLGHAGETAVLMTSGFLNPANSNEPALSLIAVFNDGTSVTLVAHAEPAYAVSTITAKGAVAILSSAEGRTTQSVIVYPGATSSARVASADFTGDGVPDLVVGTGAGLLATVRILDGANGAQLHEFEPFGPFLGGVNVAVGDLTGDGRADYVLSPDDGGGPRVRAFDGTTHEQIADFFGIDDVNFRGGARAAIGDLDHDTRGDLIVAAGLGGGPRIALFDGSQLTMTGGPKFTGDFFAFEPELRNGAYLTAGDINGDGFAELIVGGGPGGGPRVRAFDGQSLVNGAFDVRADFFAGNATERLGARVAAKDVDGDGKADILAGGVPGGAAVTRTFLADALPLSGVGVAALAVGSFDGAAALGEVFVG